MMLQFLAMFKSFKRHGKYFNIELTKATLLKTSPAETSLDTYTFSSSIF